ncbi:MAG: heme lyase CcmF/NrfE family subunit [Alphaproteobacteria bacterium]
MTAEIGHFALILALLVALVQGAVPMIGAARGDEAWMAAARPASLAQLLFITVAFASLTYAYATSDFSVANVAENSNSAMPMLYKITGVWGNHEGSLILWVFILAVFGFAVAAFGGNLPPALRARVLGVQAWIAVGFLAFLLFTSNPFLRLDPAPVDGRDLNPLLQDPGLAFHPPFLYLGYVGFSMAFSFAVAALIEGRVDAAWARWVRPWTLAAWTFLTLGIAMGSWWAYYELGWGGFWFWDPVENASFMPWLAGTALLHSAIVTEKRDTLKSWTVLLAIIAFSLSLLGTFLVRSGVLTSVHAFASDPERGLFILIFLVIVIGGSLALYAVRAPRLKAGGLFAPISREGMLVFNNLLLSTACATVLLGTLYPLALDALGGGKVSVGPPYFDMTFGPIMVPLVALTAVGPMMPWKRADLAGAVSRLRFALVAAVLAALASWSLAGGASLLPALGIGLAAWLFVGALVELGGRLKLFRAPIGESWKRARYLPRSAWGMTIAHAGLAIALAGIVASQAWRSEAIQVMHPGESVAVAGYLFTFKGAREVPGPNYTAQRGEFEVTRGGRAVARMWPEKRLYPVQRMPTTEAAIHTTWLADLYAVIGDPTEDGGWATRIYHNPLVPWIWLGAVVMVIGGGISLSDRRLRIGAPTRRARGRPAGPSPQAA